uniref:Uncharacterized protein n=1 Tax=Monopterus albus TaxID=43700 RepID=A0A3Q3IFQ1_MONAL
MAVFHTGAGAGSGDVQWCFSQVKGAIDDDVAEGKLMWSQVATRTDTTCHPVHICLEVIFNAAAVLPV